MATTGDVAALTAAQALQAERVQDTLLLLLLRLVRGFSGWYSTTAITAMTQQAAALVEAAQVQTAALSDAYLTQATMGLTGRAVRPSGALSQPDVASLRQGVTHSGVYGRLADQYRYETSQGKPAETVLADVEDRARSLAGTDLQLAQRAQERKFMVVNSVDGWRRILHPELVSSRSKAGTPGLVCGMCIAASDRVYHRDALRPIHDGCRCTVLPIVNGVDPGLSLNRDDLDALYKAAGGTDRASLKRVKFAVHEHGELGPVLRKAGDAFRGPADVPDARAA